MLFIIDIGDEEVGFFGDSDMKPMYLLDSFLCRAWVLNALTRNHTHVDMALLAHLSLAVLL